MSTATPSPLVTPDWLADHLDQVRVVDATWTMPSAPERGRELYEKAHIPGAVHFDIDLIADAASDLPHMVPGPDAFAQAVGDLGIGTGDRVVVYDATGFAMAAARVWWMFQVFGHDNVVVLDGGLKAWQAAGMEVTTAAPGVTPRSFTATPRFALVRDQNGVETALAEAATQVVDARAAARFAGTEPEPRPGIRSGHMPGAINLPFTELLVADSGLMKPITELSQVMDAAGIDPDRPIITTCGSGVTACVITLAMARLGRPIGAVYDGSWSEWGRENGGRVEASAEVAARK